MVHPKVKVKGYSLIIVILLVYPLVFPIGGLQQYQRSFSSSGKVQYSYFIYTDGSTTYLKNGMTGRIDFNSTDAALVINSAVGNLTNGGKVFIRNGSYTISPITISNDNIIFEMESWNTVLTLKAGTNQAAITVSSANGVIIRGGKIDGNKTYQSVTAVRTGGIVIDDSTNCVVENIYVTNARRYGIIIFEGAYNKVINSKVTNSTDNNITIHSSATKATHHNEVVGNEVSNASDVGIGLIGSSAYPLYDCIVERNIIYNNTSTDAVTGYNTNWGISAEAVVIRSQINDNVVYGNKLGITTRGMSYGNQIQGNTVSGGGMELWSDYDTVADNVVFSNGIQLFCTHSEIRGNIVYNNTGGAGIGVRDAADYNEITGNSVENNLQGIWLFSGSFGNYIVNNTIGNSKFEEIKDESGGNNTIRGNILNGKPTENSGVATDLANGGTIPHGLAGTPDVVVLTSLNATYKGEAVAVYWDQLNTDSTNISVDIYWTNGTEITATVIDVAWEAYYVP